MERPVDPYLLPNGTLRNKLGIPDAAELSLIENQLVTLRQAIVARQGVPFPFTLQTIRDLHRSLFQDVYDWAGDFRVCDLKKGVYEDSNVFSRFAPYPTIERRCSTLIAELTKRSFLKDLDDSAFCALAAETFTQLNSIHPFREGNGRVQRMFLALLARNIGRDIAFDVITHERMVDVSIKSHRGDLGSMTRLFHEVTDPRRIRALRRMIGFLKREAFSWNDKYIATTVAGQQYTGILAAVDRPDFMFRVFHTERDWIASGHVDDLPAEAAAQQEVRFTASHY